MILFYKKCGNIGEVYGYHNYPEVIENLNQHTCIEVDDFDFPPQQVGKISRTYIDLETKEITHVYEDAPPNSADRITQLEQDNLALKLALAESEETRINENLEIKLAIAELAEGVI